MSFQPIIPFGGNVGWSFLNKTRDAQQAAFDGSAGITRNTEYFRDTIANIDSAESLVSDRRLLEVALGAFGLEDDINNKFFVKKVLEEGTLDDAAFANRLSDKRYFAMAEAFGFDLDPPNTVLSDFPDAVIDNYKTRQFEAAVGEQDVNLRLALGLERELETIKSNNMSETAAWFTIMGTPPLRAVFEGAFRLPPQIGALDLDRQLEIFREKSLGVFGTTNPSDLLSDENQEALIRKFLLQADLSTSASATSGGAVALSLLRAQAPIF